MYISLGRSYAGLQRCIFCFIVDLNWFYLFPFNLVYILRCPSSWYAMFCHSSRHSSVNNCSPCTLLLVLFPIRTSFATLVSVYRFGRWRTRRTQRTKDKDIIIQKSVNHVNPKWIHQSQLLPTSDRWIYKCPLSCNMAWHGNRTRTCGYVLLKQRARFTTPMEQKTSEVTIRAFVAVSCICIISPVP